jgi:hypothetical protein
MLAYDDAGSCDAADAEHAFEKRAAAGHRTE